MNGDLARAPDASYKPLPELLSNTRLRALRYLPTNVPARHIVSELFVSVNTNHRRCRGSLEPPPGGTPDGARDAA
jgi:hypothetical protein